MTRIPELDALRGLAALAIVAYHVAPWRCPYGWAAVDLFFVLSGYLITSIILRHNESRSFLYQFYARRALRIWPLYYLALLVGVAVNVVALPRPDPLAGLPYYLTYTQNVHRYWFAETPPFLPYFSHTWTLANEEQFYLFWPLLACAAGRRRLVPLAVLIVAVSVAARAAGLHWSLLLARCDGFALGGLLAAVLADRPRRRLGAVRLACVPLGLASLGCLVAIAARGGLAQAAAGMATTLLVVNLFCVSVLGLVVVHAGRPALAALRVRWLCYMGQISYGLYMYHFFLGFGARALDRRLGLGYPWWMPVAILLVSIAVSALSWELVERPILALKDRFRYDARPDPPPPVAAALEGRGPGELRA
jgi:peptidoglycan/LPS O-acetylase OafA/YrhL